MTNEPWSPVSIGVDVAKDGVHVVGIYALDAETSQIFYAKHYPVPQRTWVGLTKEDMPNGENPMFDHEYFIAGMVFAAKILEEKNNV